MEIAGAPLPPHAVGERKFPIPARLKILHSTLQSAYHYFQAGGQDQLSVSHVAEWLLDNFYIIEQAIQQIREGMPAHYFQYLPKTQVAGREYAQIYLLMLGLVQRSEGRLGADQIEDCVEDYQKACPLTIGEIWAVALMLRLAVLEALAASLARITQIAFDETSFPSIDLLFPHLDGREKSVAPPADETIAVNCIIGLRLLATLDWKVFFEKTSHVERVLGQDPAQVYAGMDFETRNRYRSVIEELALGARMTELGVARSALEMAQAATSARERHVGFYLIDAGRKILERRLEYRHSLRQRLMDWLYAHALLAYLSVIAFLTLLLSLAAVRYAFLNGASWPQLLLTVGLAIIPASSVAVDLADWLVLQIVPPRVLPKLDFQGSVPPGYDTMVVIPCLLSISSDLRLLTHQLENHYLSNSDPHIHFALLTDFPDAPQKEMPGESDLILQAQAEIEALNTRYAKEGYRPFLFFHRERVWNASEECWMGRERKRGKLEEFNSLLRGGQTTYTVQFGDLAILPAIRYVLTVDADTTLPHQSVSRLIGTFAHPLNQAEFDPVTGAVVAGYTVLQPRVQVKPTAANWSAFTRIFSGDLFLDLYTRAVSNVYQDLFGEGSFVGKGIYEVDSFARSLQDRVPDNALLSHDLFEGIHGRCGLASSVILFEDYPPNYVIFSRRMHRWIRGDWQLLPWLAPQVPRRTGPPAPNDLSLLDRWKIFDNLRRSAMPLFTLAFLCSGWLFLPGSALIWTLLALSVYLTGLWTGLISSLQTQKSNRPVPLEEQFYYQTMLRLLLDVVFLPHKALISMDAILTSVNRMTRSRRRLLQWDTAAHTVHVFGRTLKIQVAWREMVAEPLFGLLMLSMLVLWHPYGLFVALPFIFVWLFSPYVAVRISAPFKNVPEPLSATQEATLRRLARCTWLYYEHFVGPEDHWLPPDHFQEDPRGLVAHRTSPTNIGLLLLATLSAHDLGYIGLPDLALRIRSTFDGMDGLERQRGHFLNWYDTRTQTPLRPRYISTVDSGNLAACLLALRQGCLEAPARPLVRWSGLTDTLDMLAYTLQAAQLGRSTEQLYKLISELRQKASENEQSTLVASYTLIASFHEKQEEVETLLDQLIESSDGHLEPAFLHQLSTWIERANHHISNIERDLRRLCPWVPRLFVQSVAFPEKLASPELLLAWQQLLSVFAVEPTLRSIPGLCELGLEALERFDSLLETKDKEVAEWCQSFRLELGTAQAESRNLLKDFQYFASQSQLYVTAMDFRFLCDRQRLVFHIGYNVESGQLDGNYYDLLASEARLASLVAIGKGDVPQSHWLYLSRPLTWFRGKRLLLSWSATMFEYLMPTLLAANYPNTLLDQTCRAVVERQIAYGKEKGVPWGVSESSYYYFDASQVYQYRAFGVPGLGYKRGLEEDLVIAPYASLLALPFAPRAVAENIAHLQKLGMQGLYGLYESVDFTPARLRTGQDYAIVRSYMAHHQGMILLALNNHLRDNVMVDRFQADPTIETVDLLLQERPSPHAPIQFPHPQKVEAARSTHPLVSLDAWHVKPTETYLPAHNLSNGSYNLFITATGGGYSHWKDIDLTRWRADSSLDHWGSWIYIQDLDGGKLWSATSQPVPVHPGRQEARFFPHRVEFERRDADISLLTSIIVAPAADVEINWVTVTNYSAHVRSLALTSYAEVILSAQSADTRHPAFNRLFIESEYLDDEDILLFHRRLRSAQEKPVYLAHFALGNSENVSMLDYETDRVRFLGRGGTPRDPAALRPVSGPLSKTTGVTLDPIFALRTQLTLYPYRTLQVAYVTLAADSREEAIELARRYRHWSQIYAAYHEAGDQAAQSLLDLELTSAKLQDIEKLLSVLSYPSPALRADPAILAANTLCQPDLWRFSISGDYPILLVRLKSETGFPLLNELVRAHKYWRKRGLMVDLVILNQHESGYDQSMNNKIYRLLSRSDSDDWVGKRGGIFILNEDQLAASERILLATVARAVLEEDAGSLAQQLEKLNRQPLHLPAFVAMKPPLVEDPATWVARPTDLLFDNGLGGFSPDGREYLIYLDRGQMTPAPWINVIANPRFGCLVSEMGLGCTWAENSGENRLTPWRNDPVGDLPSEAIYLRDEDTGQVWSPTPLPARADAPYLIRHGLGYSIFEHTSHGLKQHLRVFAAPDEPIKVVSFELQNKTSQARRISISYYAEWVLGSTREQSAQYIVPEFDSQHFALLAHNPYSHEFGKRVAFLAASREPNTVTADRTEFLGAPGDYARPAALGRLGLNTTIQAGADPCAVMQILVWLAPEETKEFTFLIGQGEDRGIAEALIAHYQNVEHVRDAWNAVISRWQDLAGGVKVRTPDPAMDILLNHWLLYEALSCRIWGRTAFYQSSGAFGFRDQLQDVLALLHSHPEIARAHILEAASHQFEEGDVLHWWHPPSGRGIRTRISDNLLWLPYVTAEYVRISGDASILNEPVPFLHAEPLKKDEDERYGQFPVSDQVGTLYEHCLRALTRGATTGEHGLPLMGTGDWNDGMNRVGIEGRGESVWLGWFIFATSSAFAHVCELMDDRQEAEICLRRAIDLRQALEAHAWAKDWYLRAYFDDGTPLGSAERHECKIDSISQSWAVLSGAVNGDHTRSREAMASLYARLVRPQDGLILLLTPPFDRTARDPGYIKGYPPGIRENGGQYTHAALWAVWAFAKLGQGDRAGELFHMLNPIHHADTPAKVQRYRVEPYVVAADVYSVPPHVGRGGWTWYTGSAGWMYRLGIEAILGLQRTGDTLKISPCIPSAWRDFEIDYRFGKASYHIRVENPYGLNTGVWEVFVDGKVTAEKQVSLVDDSARHEVLVTMG